MMLPWLLRFRSEVALPHGRSAGVQWAGQNTNLTPETSGFHLQMVVPPVSYDYQNFRGGGRERRYPSATLLPDGNRSYTSLPGPCPQHTHPFKGQNSHLIPNERECTMDRSTSVPKTTWLTLSVSLQTGPQTTDLFWNAATAGCPQAWGAHRHGVQGCSQWLPCEQPIDTGREGSPHPSSSPATSPACLAMLWGVGNTPQNHLFKKKKQTTQTTHKAAKGNQVKTKSTRLQADSCHHE